MDITDIADYQVIRQLGAGGMGQVFLVQHPRLPRQDALKLLDAGVSRNDDFKARFQREADLLAQLSHPNIVTLHDRGEFEGRLWITMEFIDGTDAAALLRTDGPLDPDLAIYLIAGAGAALDHAWRKQRITHRDVKPANILVGIERAAEGPVIESVKLADFGIAKAAGESTSLTSTGMTVGTMQYISPEAIEGEAVDNRSDIYSLGCTAFHLLTGQPPFAATSIASAMSAHLTRPVPLISKLVPHLTPAMDATFQRALAKDPTHRYQSCAEFVAALQKAAGPDLHHPAGAQTMAAAAWPIRDAVDPDAPTMLKTDESRTASAPRARSRTAVGLAAGVAFLAIAAGSLATYLLMGDSDTSTAPPESSTAVMTPPAPAPTPAPTTPPTTVTTTTTTATAALPAYPPPNTGCTGTVTAHYDYEHPQLGPMRLFLFIGENRVRMDSGCVSAVMPSGSSLPPTPLDAGLGLGFADPAIDATGNLFIEFRSMSAHAPPQVLVLVPNAYGFREIGQDLINIELVGPGADGRYALLHSMNDCTPSCAEGTWTEETLTWDGSSYVA
ncbi:serine/threonine-protein kinase [Mycolicibacterium hippocampi]|uniref:non-specific serine/threonine protein kinase n=1 Tax=Mycolicibacterium hippocampi TaxID=659824 RepID=A0A850PLH9_9MYCO|nr:Serine/threonine protein kinase [Mycolicibacterium hippocampi]